MHKNFPSNNGFSSQPSYEIEILLEKAIYNPGDLITGEIRLHLKRKLCCELITVQLYGSARVFFTEKITKPGTLSQTKAYEQENVLLNLKTDVWKCPENEKPKREVSLNDIARMASSTAIRLPTNKAEKQPGIEIGVHSLPFSFQLPDNGLYTSFDAKDAAGYVRYYILVQALSNGITVARKKLLFPIVVHKFLSMEQRSIESPVLSGSKKVGTGQISVELRLKKRGFVPGEPLWGDIVIENKSEKSVKYSHFRIIQKSICYSSRPEVQTYESFFETAGMGLPIHKVVSGQKFEYPIQFYLPALVPNLVVPGCIEVEYEACLDVGLIRRSAKSSIISLNTPILIGTHPVTDQSLISALGFYDENLRYRSNLPSAPPAYEGCSEIASIIDIPPSYSASIGGLSSVEDTETTEYTPLYYKYNFQQYLDNDLKLKEKEQ